MTEEGMDPAALEAVVDEIFEVVVGYVPDDGEDLRISMDSLQRLEFLIEAEERLPFTVDDVVIPEDDVDTASAWWARRSGWIEHLAAQAARAAAT
jgi:hypothetical protein